VRIAIYTIAKNEEKNVPGWFDSIVEGGFDINEDSVTFCDTGSDDDTPSLFSSLSGYKDYHQIRIDPWRFDDAHNAALALVPADADVCIPLHLDERLCEGWRAKLEAKWQLGLHTKAMYTYEFDPSYRFMQNRIHARRGYRWLYPAHEGVYPYGGVSEHTAWIPDLVITQTQDRSLDRTNRDLKLLEMAIRETPNSARMNYYYGRQLMYSGLYHEALHFLERYSTLPGTFDDERKQVLGCMAQCKAALTAGPKAG
jgi:hypothetical protein